MKENSTLRRAVLGDAVALGDCFDAAYAQYAARIDDLPPMSAACAEDIANHQVWVAEIDDTIVGGLVLIPRDGFMLLANVAVHPNQRGGGIGQRLLQLAESETRKYGLTELRLNTHVDMPENVRLYARNGWDQVGQQGNKISMKKTLPS